MYQLFVCSLSSIVQHQYQNQYWMSCIDRVSSGIRDVLLRLERKIWKTEGFLNQYQMSCINRVSSGIQNVLLKSETKIRKTEGFSNTNSLPSWQGQEVTLCRVFTPHSTLYKVLCKSHKHQCIDSLDMPSCPFKLQCRF